MYCVHKKFVKIYIREITEPKASAVFSKEGRVLMYLISNDKKKITLLIIFDTSSTRCQNNFIPTSYFIFM